MTEKVTALVLRYMYFYKYVYKIYAILENIFLCQKVHFNFLKVLAG